MKRPVTGSMRNIGQGCEESCSEWNSQACCLSDSNSVTSHKLCLRWSKHKYTTMILESLGANTECLPLGKTLTLDHTSGVRWGPDGSLSEWTGLQEDKLSIYCLGLLAWTSSLFCFLFSPVSVYLRLVLPLAGNLQACLVPRTVLAWSGVSSLDLVRERKFTWDGECEPRDHKDEWGRLDFFSTQSPKDLPPQI